MDFRKNSLRLRGHDYIGTADYFVTVCTDKRRCIFGACARGRVALSEIGLIVEEQWRGIPQLRADVYLDDFQVMPNHFHGIVFLARDGSRQALGAIIRGFKAVVTSRARTVLRDPTATIWQRNYYDRIIRSERELERTREYIRGNPWTWGRQATLDIDLSDER